MDADTSDAANSTFVVYLDGEEIYCDGKNDDKYKDAILLNHKLWSGITDYRPDN
jgi:hypothetical protein